MDHRLSVLLPRALAKRLVRDRVRPGLRYRGTRAESERADPTGRLDEPNHNCDRGSNDDESCNKGNVALSISPGSHAPQP